MQILLRSEHFMKNNFVHNMMAKIIGLKQNKIIKSDGVKSIKPIKSIKFIRYSPNKIFSKIHQQIK